MNPFANPQYYRDLILQEMKLNQTNRNFLGKSFICVSLTKFCPVGCKFCFFSSPAIQKDKTIVDTFDSGGIAKFIQFANEANLGYLLVSGGGEPFIEREHLLKVVEEVQSDKIVLVTSGNWAKSKAGCNNFTQKIYEAFKRRKTPTELVIRLSVDLEHQAVGLNPAYFLISLFEENYLHEPAFKLQFHTLFDDPCIDEILKKLESRIVSISEARCQSDANTIVKVNPAEKIIEFDSGLKLKIGYAKIFYSNVKVDLTKPGIIERNLSVFMRDLNESEQNNPSKVVNTDGTDGLDFWVNYNGNVTTWGNQSPDNLFNLYEDSYQDVVNGTFGDPISLYYLEKGDRYRDAIIKEVNPIAVIRAKATNVRDYTASIMLQEEKTRLYLSIRVLQEFIREKRFGEMEIRQWPEEIQVLVRKNKEDLIELYQNTDYSIVDQYMNQPFFDEDEWLDLFEVIKLGHYEVTDKKLEEAFCFYNANSKGKSIDSLSEIGLRPHSSSYQERIIQVKQSVKNQLVASV